MLAISTGVYDTLKFFHVLASTTWGGKRDLSAGPRDEGDWGRVTRPVSPPRRRTSGTSGSD